MKTVQNSVHVAVAILIILIWTTQSALSQSGSSQFFQLRSLAGKSAVKQHPQEEFIRGKETHGSLEIMFKLDPSDFIRSILDPGHDVLDSTYCYQYVALDDTWKNEIRYYYTYNGNNNKITELSRIWYDWSQSWTNEKQTDWTYNADTLCVEQMVRMWYQNQWDTTSRYTYAYDTHNRLVTEKEQTWRSDLGEWRTLAIDTLIYNDEGLLTIRRRVDLYGDNSRYQYEYINGRIIIATYQEQDYTELWKDKSRILYTYNEQFLISKELRQNWVEAAWQNVQRDSLTYNTQDNLDRVSEWLWDIELENWIERLQVKYTYDTSQNLVGNLIQASNPSTYDWAPDSRDVYLYNEYDSIIEITEQSWDKHSGSWVNWGRKVYDYDNTGHMIYQATLSIIDSTEMLNYEDIWEYNDSNDLIKHEWYGFIDNERLCDKFNYDALGLLGEKLRLEWDTSAMSWTNVDRDVYEYNMDDSLIQMVYQLWNASDETWSNKYRVIKDYDENNLLQQSITQNWYQDWINSTRSVYVYDMEGRLEESRHESWSDEWIRDFRETYEYNETNDTTAYGSWYWASAEENWIHVDSQSNTFDSKHRILHRQFFTWDFDTMQWELKWERTFAYDANGNVIQNLYIRYYSKSGNGYLYTYDSLGNLLEEVRLDWNSTISDWVNTHRILYLINAFNKPFEMDYFEWNGSTEQWDTLARILIFYDEIGNEILLFYQEKDFEGNWVNGAKVSSEYDSIGNLSIKTWNYWEPSSYDWVDSFRYEHYWSPHTVSGNIVVDQDNFQCVYPNPFSPFTSGLYCSSTVDQVYTLQLYNSMGQLVLSKKMITGEVYDMTDNLSAGVYILIARSADHLLYEDKIVFIGH